MGVGQGSAPNLPAVYWIKSRQMLTAHRFKYQIPKWAVQIPKLGEGELQGRRTLSRLISWQSASHTISEEPVFWLEDSSLRDSKMAFVSTELSEPRSDMSREWSYSCHALRAIRVWTMLYRLSFIWLGDPQPP